MRNKKAKENKHTLTQRLRIVKLNFKQMNTATTTTTNQWTERNLTKKKQFILS